MEDDRGAAASSGWASTSAVVALAAAAPPAPPPPPPPPPNPPKAAAAAAVVVSQQRQRFTVDLRPSETTIVSWKKLLKDSSKGTTGPEADIAGAEPVLGSSAAGPNAAVQPTEGETEDAVPAPNRFSSVIEKIERLYMGKQSSDEEELDDIPDDDQYNTEDSFIDDAELDEYFQVDKLATKHNGYFVNRGKLEGIELSSSPKQTQKKRRRNDSIKNQTEKDNEHIPSELVNMGNMRIKAAARSAPLAGKILQSPKTLTNYGEHNHNVKHLKGKSNAPMGTYKKNSAGFTMNSDNASSVKVSDKDTLSLSLESNELAKHKTGVVSSRDLAHKSRGTSESFDGMYQASRDKGVSSKKDPHTKRIANDENDMELSTKIRRKERNGVSELPDLNSSGNACPLQIAQPSAMRVTEGSIVRPKGTTLERAIHDLEKIVSESRPPNLDAQEVDASSQAIKRRLPQDIKQKLAKVARLSASQGKISKDELVDRLMGILGHIMQRTTLKRHMKEMVELGISAKQWRADRFQKIKKEAHEMIRTHVSLMRSKVSEQQDGSADDFQEVISNDEKIALKGKYSMDKALEDKICDLYDLYVEGMDEDKGPQSRKLYVQLAELWPNGYMDNLEIKDAIYRSKQRKIAMYRKRKVRREERIKRKILASSTRVEETTPGAQVRAGQERPAADSAGPPASSGRSADQVHLSNSEPHHKSKHYDKARGSISVGSTLEDGRKFIAADVKKKVKRKPESDIEESIKLPTQRIKERPMSQKQSDESNVTPHPLTSLQLPTLPGSTPPS